MTKKVNPNLFRLKNINLFENKNILFFDDLNQYYLFNRNIYFFINKFKQFNFFFFEYKIQKSYLNNFKIFFLGYIKRKWKYFNKIKKKIIFGKTKKFVFFVFAKKKNRNNFIQLKFDYFFYELLNKNKKYKSNLMLMKILLEHLSFKLKKYVLNNLFKDLKNNNYIYVLIQNLIKNQTNNINFNSSILTLFNNIYFNRYYNKRHDNLQYYNILKKSRIYLKVETNNSIILNIKKLVRRIKKKRYTCLFFFRYFLKKKNKEE